MYMYNSDNSWRVLDRIQRFTTLGLNHEILSPELNEGESGLVMNVSVYSIFCAANRNIEFFLRDENLDQFLGSMTVAPHPATISITLRVRYQDAQRIVANVSNGFPKEQFGIYFNGQIFLPVGCK